MSATCDSCRRRIRGEGKRTATRTLCDACYETYLSSALGVMAARGDVPTAVSTAGWRERLRRKSGDA